jgi:hypothetical protein
VNATNAIGLAATLARDRDRVLLFRTLVRLRTDIALFDDVEQLQWSGPTPSLDALAARFDAAITQAKRPARGRSR